jgi:hypothetical protein
MSSESTLRNLYPKNKNTCLLWDICESQGDLANLQAKS